MSNCKDDGRSQHVRYPATLLRKVRGYDVESDIEGVASSNGLSPPGGFAEHLGGLRDVIVRNDSAAW